MSNIEFKFNASAVKTEILQADWMKSFIETEAKKKADADQHIKSFVGFDRVKAFIYPNTREHPS